MEYVCISYLRHNLQLLPLTHILALTHSLLELAHDLLIEGRSTGDRNLDLASGGRHDDGEFVAHALEHRQAVVLGEGVEEIGEGIALVLHARALRNLGHDLLLVAHSQSRSREDGLQFWVPLEGVVHILQRLGDGLEGGLLRCCCVLSPGPISS